MHTTPFFTHCDQGNIKLAILDHITSMPAMVLPVKEMTRLCHEYGVPEVAACSL